MTLINVKREEGLPKSTKLLAVFTQTNSLNVFCYLITPRSEFFWDGSFFLDPLASFGVSDSQAPGMKHKPRGPKRLADWFTVNGISKQGLPKNTIVHPDLMRPASMQCAKNQ